MTEPAFKSNLLRATETMREQMSDASDRERQAEQAAELALKVSGTTLSVGSMAWLLRGSTLMASALSSIPTWQGFDPLPVLPGKRDPRAMRNYRPRGTEADIDTQERDAGQILDSIPERDLPPYSCLLYTSPSPRDS